MPSAGNTPAGTAHPPSPLIRARRNTATPKLKRFVFEVPFALQCLGVFVLAQNIFVELDVGAKKVLEPRFDALPIFQHLFGDVISVDIDADRAYDSEFLSLDRDRCAFEF